MTGMSENSFEEQYKIYLKEVFSAQVLKDIAQGIDARAKAQEYAERGKPEFTLAYLLHASITIPDEEKSEIFAHAYEQRALISESKAQKMSNEFNTSFPLVHSEAQKDRVNAQHIRANEYLEGTRPKTRIKTLKML